MREREWQKYGRNSPEDIKASKERGAEGACRQQSRDCPAAHGAAHGEAAVPLQPVQGLMPGQVDAPCMTLGPQGEPALEQAPGRYCSPWREEPTLKWVFRLVFWFFRGSMLEQDVPGRTAPCGRDLEQFLKNCWLWECAPLWSSSVRTVSHVKDPTLERGTSMRRKESQRWRALNWPQGPCPVLLHCSTCGGGRFISEAEPGKKEEAGGESGFRFFFHLPTLLLNGSNLN